MEILPGDVFQIYYKTAVKGYIAPNTITSDTFVVVKTENGFGLGSLKGVKYFLVKDVKISDISDFLENEDDIVYGFIHMGGGS